MGALDATLTEALTSLETTWQGIRDGVLCDRHLLWIGSAISGDRFPALSDLLQRLFAELHAFRNPADPDCPYLKAAKEIAGYYPVNSGVNLEDPPSAWPVKERTALLKGLENRYADVLGVLVRTPGGPKNIPFDILKLPDLYSNSLVTPDAEHRFLALLVAEGAITQIITTNWDPLIERAYARLNVGDGLQSVASTRDLDHCLDKGAIIFKVHGCAEKTVRDPALYKGFMVATHQDIVGWASNPLFQAFVDKVRTMLRERPSLFIGISGQDYNIQAQCVAVKSLGPPIPFPPPRVTFSSSHIAGAQIDVLKAIHRDDYDMNIDAIERSAALPLYGKPLLGATYVSLVLQKVKIILDAGDAHFPNAEHRTLAGNGLVQLRNWLCGRFDGASVVDRWRELADEIPGFITRLLKLWNEQEVPLNMEEYMPINTLHGGKMASDPHIVRLGLHWLFLCLAAFAEGAVNGHWNLNYSSAPDGVDGQFTVTEATGNTAIFLLSDPTNAAAKLSSSGFLTSGSGIRALLIYPNGREPKSPTRNPGRTLAGVQPLNGPSEVWFEDCALNSPDAATMIDMLKNEMIAARVL